MANEPHGIIRRLPVILIVQLLSVSVLFQSCSIHYYSPNNINVPMLAQKGEGNVTLTAGATQADGEIPFVFILPPFIIADLKTSRKNNAYDLQGAYSPKDHFGIMGGFSILSSHTDYHFWENMGESYNGVLNSQTKMGGIGAGYYNSWRDNWVGDVYGILSYGQYNNWDNRTNLTSGQNEVLPESHFGVSMMRTGVHTGISYNNDHFIFALSQRTSLLSYFNANGTVRPIGFTRMDTYKPGNQFIFEPAVTLGVGFSNCILRGQAGLCYNPTCGLIDLIWNVGLNYHFLPKEEAK